MINITDVSLIQELRAIHAISELNIRINIDKTDEHKFELLKYYFNMKYSLGFKEGVDILEILKIDHTKPLTSIYSVTKPLIYPKAIINNLRERWQKRRNFEFGFSGLLTSERKNIIENWLLNVSNKSYNLNYETYTFKVKRKIFFKLNISKPLIKKFDKFYLSSSNRGRVFPGKSWDDNYYNFLLSSKFILCPSGVYTWTYRFFESILCGAIPVVENHSPSYKGFKYYTMGDELSNLLWSKEIADYNFKLCIERITLSEEDISSIINEISGLSKE